MRHMQKDGTMQKGEGKSLLPRKVCRCLGSTSNAVPRLTHCQFIEAAKAASGGLSSVAMLEQQLPVDAGILPPHAFTSGIVQQLSPKFTLRHVQ